MLTTASTHPAVPSTKLSTSPRYFAASVRHKYINEQSTGVAGGGGASGATSSGSRVKGAENLETNEF
jgi:hypothetical protein